MPHTPQHFDTMFAHDPDPWAFRSRWYEARKRALTLACLPEARYASGYEPGCANGELSSALAPRCDRLLATDGSAIAVALARQRLAAFDHVEVREAWLPAAWPEQRFDLIVVSELGYFLEPNDWDVLIDRLATSLLPGATLLACHWRRPFEGGLQDGDAVHRRLDERLGLPCLMRVVDADLRIDVWCDDPRSVAERERIF